MYVSLKKLDEETYTKIKEKYKKYIDHDYEKDDRIDYRAQCDGVTVTGFKSKTVTFQGKKARSSSKDYIETVTINNLDEETYNLIKSKYVNDDSENIVLEDGEEFAFRDNGLTVIGYKDNSISFQGEKARSENSKWVELLMNSNKNIVIIGYFDRVIDFFDRKPSEIVGYIRDESERKTFLYCCNIIPFLCKNWNAKWKSFAFTFILIVFVALPFIFQNVITNEMMNNELIKLGYGAVIALITSILVASWQEYTQEVKERKENIFLTNRIINELLWTKNIVVKCMDYISEEPGQEAKSEKEVDRTLISTLIEKKNTIVWEKAVMKVDISEDDIFNIQTINYVYSQLINWHNYLNDDELYQVLERIRNKIEDTIVSLKKLKR